MQVVYYKRQIGVEAQNNKFSRLKMSRETADAVVGMMDAAYFTGRKELLEFFNDLLDLSLTKIEQTATGAVACQLTDYIFPGSIPMSRVNWGARSDYEFVQNYKLLQNAFGKRNVQRHIDVDRLIRAKYQDNLEFCQWLKAFVDQSGIYREDYDALAIRSKGKGGKTYECNVKGLSSRGGAQRSAPTRPTARSAGTATSRTTAPRSTMTRKPTVESRANNKEDSNIKNTSVTKARAEAILADATLMKKNAELTTHAAEVEIERDWYLGKLRSIETMLQIYQENSKGDTDSNATVDKVFKVLYASIEENIEVGDDGEFLDDNMLDKYLPEGEPLFNVAPEEGELLDDH